MRWSTALGLMTAAVAAGYAAQKYRRYYSFTGKTVVITGGSRGLGLELARVFIREGAKVALLARDEHELQRSADELEAMGGAVATAPVDITDPKATERTLCEIAEEFGGIDVLVNNAGVIQVGPLEVMTADDFHSAMAIHFRGPLNLMLAAIPYLRRRGGGRIVNIVSVGGKIAVPHLAPYSASKFALAGLSHSVASELRGEGIYVTTVFPGLMRTGSIYQAGFKGQPKSEFRWFAVSASTPLLSMSSARAAQQIVNACRYGKSEIVLGVPTKAAVLFHQLFPNLSAELLALAAQLMPSTMPDARWNTMPGKAVAPGSLPKFATTLSDRAAKRNNQAMPAMA